ncbi:helix-turn-helix transcriptional regulator [Empedobacter falsenii]
MAKSNSPHFWSRFQEVYPNFIYKLLEINPNLKNSELTFLAYFYLGFTTKDIAIYTHKALKTIENNRYNIRKRLSLSSDKDLIIWLKTYIDN